jgi:large subunit ribosomal protein L28
LNPCSVRSHASTLIQITVIGLRRTLSGTLFRLPDSGTSSVSTYFWERIPVAAVCDICGKRPGFGHNVPWSKKKTNRRWNPNIQRVHAVVSGTPKRLNVCASCIKAGKVSR